MDIERMTGPRGAMLAIRRGTELPAICLMCAARKNVEPVDFGVRSHEKIRSELLPLCKTCISGQSQSAMMVAISRALLLVAAIGLIVRGYEEMTRSLQLSLDALMALNILTLGAFVFSWFARATAKKLTPRYDEHDRVLVDVPTAVADAVVAEKPTATKPTKSAKKKRAS